MSNFFSYFPKIKYGFNTKASTKTAVNITLRFIIKKIIESKGVIYYDYSIQDGDRPDIIAAKYYGSPDYDWLVMIVNDIFDVNYDWPMDSYTFEKFIIGKYGSIAAAKSQVNRYEWIFKPEQQDAFGNVTPERVLVVDKDTYDTLGMSNRREISNFQHESLLNEKKRSINILDRRYLDQIIREAEEILE